MRTSPAVAVVLERCNRLLAIVIDAVDLKHFLPRHKLLTRRRIFPRFWTKAIYCLLFPKITARWHISVSLNAVVLPSPFPQCIHSTKLAKWPITYLALIVLFQEMVHNSLPSSCFHLALDHLLTHHGLFLNKHCKWLRAIKVDPHSRTSVLCSQHRSQMSNTTH